MYSIAKKGPRRLAVNNQSHYSFGARAFSGTRPAVHHLPLSIAKWIAIPAKYEVAKIERVEVCLQWPVHLNIRVGRSPRQTFLFDFGFGFRCIFFDS